MPENAINARNATIDKVGPELKSIIGAIGGGMYDGAFSSLYPRRTGAECRERYIGLINRYIDCFLGDGGGNSVSAAVGSGGGNSVSAAVGSGGGSVSGVEGGGGLNATAGPGSVVISSAPGRTEVCGNHTDHQRGNVLAAAIDLDIICVAAPNGLNSIRLKSIGHAGMIDVDLSVLSPLENERGDATALIRGLAAWFSARGVRLSGFDAYTTSDVLVGSGLSSSAAFEVAVGTAMNAMFGAGLSAQDIAIAGQYAENQFFGKPCGLMDQTASSVGGFVRIDFGDPRNPIVEPIQYDPAADGLSLCVVNTKGSHADLIGEYAAIPAEMRAVASYFGKEYLREVDENEFYSCIADIRDKLREKVNADRALLRAIHFFRENKLVAETAGALKAADKQRFLGGIIRSGHSSFTCLQNIYAVSAPGEQGLSVALALSEAALGGAGGAWRVHGGGFAGTIMAFVPAGLNEEYKRALEAVFGEGSCIELSIRKQGGVIVTPDMQGA